MLRLAASLCLGAALACAQNVSTAASTLLSHVEKARDALSHSNRSAALEQISQASTLAARILQSAAEAPPVMAVLFETAAPAEHGDIVSEQLDVTSAFQRLQQAFTDLSGGDSASASYLLLQIQESVIRDYRHGDLPLLQAELNLEWARSRVLEGDYEAAPAPLLAAAQALADFNSLFPGPEINDIAYLRAQILERVAAIRKNRDDAQAWIEYWLLSVHRWEKKQGITNFGYQSPAV